jgi:hypothetical protein
MSGHKSTIISISNEDYQRIYETERNEYYKRITDGQFERSEVVYEKVQNLQNEIQDRHFDYVYQIDTLSDEIRELENKMSDELLLGQIDILKSETDYQVQNIQSSLADHINHQSQLENQINQVEKKFNDDLTQLQTRMESQEKLNGQKINLANDFLDAAFLLLSTIQATYPEHCYDQGIFYQLQSQLEIAQEDIRIEEYPSALSLAQISYTQLSKMKRDAELNYFNWRLIRNEVLERIEKIKIDLSKNREIQTIDKTGELLDIYVETNYWSSGKYAEIELKINEIEQFILDNGESLPIAEIYDIMNNHLAIIEDEFIHCIIDARLAALNAQIRYEIANSVLLALVEQGFFPVSGDYQEGNYLNCYQASAVKPGGNKVNIYISPGPSGDILNSLDIISLDKNIVSKEELHLRAKEIQKSLFNQGLNIGDFHEENDNSGFSENSKLSLSLPKNTNFSS